MKRGSSEAFKDSYHNEEVDGESEPREAIILPFKRKEDVKTNPMWAKHAYFMAKMAGITISDETVKKYETLRNEKPDPEKENHSGMSDHELLAEALRMSGDMSSFTTFTEKYPHIFKKKT